MGFTVLLYLHFMEVLAAIQLRGKFVSQPLSYGRRT